MFKVFLLLSALLIQSGLLARELNCEARYEVNKSPNPIRETWPMKADTGFGKSLYTFDGAKAYYSLSLDRSNDSYQVAINFAPKYLSGVISSGKLREDQKPITLSYVNGDTVFRIVCIAK